MNERVQNLAKNEIDDLVAIGDELITTAANSGDPVKPEVVGRAKTWLARTGQLISKLYGKDSLYLESYRELIERQDFLYLHGNNYSQLCELQGILKAVQHEIEAGLLAEIRHLLQADIFADFLAMAEHLLSEGYKDAAAVMIGAVLEDSLRKISDAHRLPTTRNARQLTIDPLDVALAQAGVYGALIQKQVTTWA